MKPALLSLLILAAIAAAEDPSPHPPAHPPALFRPTYSVSLTQEEARFASCENIGGSGFYWLDTRAGDLWRLDPAVKEWIFLGSPRGANSSRKGTYTLLSDRRGGVYVLHTETGKGWWTDGTVWETLGEPSRRMKREE
ncbi:MAG: hypothetical protein JEZ10_01025 [Verrucomicrobia bacterium]|nr:hypothetical protein [Verrucomicrobiota bacterium]